MFFIASRSCKLLMFFVHCLSNLWNFFCERTDARWRLCFGLHSMDFIGLGIAQVTMFEVSKIFCVFILFGIQFSKANGTNIVFISNLSWQKSKSSLNAYENINCFISSVFTCYLFWFLPTKNFVDKYGLFTTQFTSGVMLIKHECTSGSTVSVDSSREIVRLIHFNRFILLCLIMNYMKNPKTARFPRAKISRKTSL